MTKADHTPLYLQREDGSIEQLAYRSALWCPTCSGEGTYEVMRHTSNPTAVEPEWDVIACETCGGDNEPDGGPGTGTRPVIRCATCNLPVHPEVLAIQGNYDDATFEDEEEEYDIVRGMDARDRAKIEWCSCEHEDIQATARTARLTMLRVRMLASMKGDDPEAGEPLMGLHGVTVGVVLALGWTAQYWRRLHEPSYSYLSAPVAASDDHAISVTLYSGHPLPQAAVEHVYAMRLKINDTGKDGC